MFINCMRLNLQASLVKVFQYVCGQPYFCGEFLLQSNILLIIYSMMLYLLFIFKSCLYSNKQFSMYINAIFVNIVDYVNFY